MLCFVQYNYNLDNEAWRTLPSAVRHGTALRRSSASVPRGTMQDSDRLGVSKGAMSRLTSKTPEYRGGSSHAYQLPTYSPTNIRVNSPLLGLSIAGVFKLCHVLMSMASWLNVTSIKLGLIKYRVVKLTRRGRFQPKFRDPGAPRRQC
jgi:hypothetical protein